MNRLLVAGCGLCLALVTLVSPTLAADLPYVQHQNIVYADAYGVALVMDIFVPTGKPNGLGIVDVISGAWSSDRSKIRDHKLTQTFDIMGRKGYTVFAIRPGSLVKFSGQEMHSHLKMGIRWVKEHATEYKIDPARLGLMGASAGGHLACLAAVQPDEAKDGKPGTEVKACAVFFPPTDFTKEFLTVLQKEKPKVLLGLVTARGEQAPGEDEVKERLIRISPALQVTEKAPPFLLIHGDADPLVPLQQSEVMVAALKAKNVPAELIVKAGGGHPWFTIHEEVQVIGDWFDKQLAVSTDKPATTEPAAGK